MYLKNELVIVKKVITSYISREKQIAYFKAQLLTP